MKAYRQKLEQQFLQQTAPLRARYEALQPREQVLVTIAAGVVAFALAYALIWQPFARARVRYALDLEAARAVAQSLAAAQAEVASGAGQNFSVIGSDVSLLTAVDQAAKSGTLNKAPARLQPDGENQARVWLEDVQFDVLMRWMYELQNNYGLHIDVADIERQPTSGLVNARLSLTRTP